MKPATHPNEDPAWMPTPAASAEARVSLRFVAGISVSLVVHGLLLGLLLLQQGGGGETAAQATSPLLVEWQVADPVPVPLPRVELPVPQPEAAPMSRAAPAAARDDAAAALAVSDVPAPEPLLVAQRAPNAASRSSEDASESLPTPTPTPATSAAASAADAYVWDVLAHLRRFQHYPERARQRDVEGTVWLRARVSRRGVVLRSDIERSSGHDLLDRAAARLIAQSSPLPPPPAGAFAITDLRLPVEYRLRRE